MKWRISQWSLATRLLLINLSAVLVLGGILFVSFYFFKNIERLVTGIVKRDIPQVIVNSHAGEELTSVFAELLVDIYYGREDVVKTKTDHFEKVINQLFIKKAANPRLQESLEEFMHKLSLLNDQSENIKSISEKFKETENEIVYSFEVLQDIIDEKIEALSLGAEDALTLRYMEQLKAMNTRYRGVFLDITMQIVELKRGNTQFISERKHPVLIELDFFHLELQTILAAGPEIRDQGKSLIQLVLNYKRLVTRFVQATAEFHRQLKEVSDSKENIMNVFKEVNEDVAIAAKVSQEHIDARLQSSGRIIIFLSIAVFGVILLITYSVFNMFKELQKRTTELAEATDVAKAANVAKSEFLARMSHEIRTPLNAVTGLTSVVLKSDLTGEQRDYLNKVQIASNNLLEVINDILDFSKVEAGRLELMHAHFDLDQLLEQMADLFSNRVAQKDIELVFTASTQVPRQLTGDASRLTQVLTNLIENAVKFTDSGEIVVRVEPDDPVIPYSPFGLHRTRGDHVSLGSMKDEGRGRLDNQLAGQVILKFTVSDTGTGIAADVLPTLFEPFTQADSYLTRAHEGTGLGLAICRRLAKLMGGTITAESTPGRGSIFSFTVVMEAQKEEKPRLSLPPDLQGLKTLVVDDSETARQVLCDQLESFNFNVTAVDSGKKALEELEKATADEPYQLVLLDWKMHGMDGVEVARRIRDMQWNPTIILITGYGHELMYERNDKSVIDALLLKPVKPSELFNIIMELLGQAEALVKSGTQKPTIPPIDRLSGRRALVVEDSELNRDVAVALLEEAGIVVDVAENGQVAVEKVAGSPNGFFNAVLMDIQMPVMDGYEATRRIRAWEASKCGIPNTKFGVRNTELKPESSIQYPASRIPIIALTAHALKGEKEKCLDTDMDDYLAKPLDEQDLHRVLLKWMPPLKEETTT